MSLSYGGKTFFKLSNFTNIIFNFNNNGSEKGKSGIKTTYCPGMLTREVRKNSRHVGT